MEEKTRYTKKDYLEELKNIVINSNSAIKGELIYFLETQIASVEKKAEYARKKAEEKKENEDEIEKLILETLSYSHFMSLVNLLNQIGSEEITKAKVVSRLTKLNKMGKIEKGTLLIDNNSTRVAYKLR